MTTKKLNITLFQLTLVSWLLLFGISAAVTTYFPSTLHFLSGSLFVYTTLIVIFWVFRAVPLCSKNVFGVIIWLIFGSLIVGFLVMLLLTIPITLNNVKLNGLTSLIVITLVMMLSSCFFIFANRKDKHIVDKVKVNIYISAFIFSVALSISNIYSINVTDYNQIPSLPFKVSLSTIKAVGFSPRNFESYMLTLLTFPFLTLNVFLRMLAECMNYQSKRKQVKEA